MHNVYNLQLVRKDLEKKLLAYIVEGLKTQDPQKPAKELIKQANGLWKQWPQRSRLSTQYPFLAEIETKLTDLLKTQLTSQLTETVVLKPEFMDEVAKLLPENKGEQAKKCIIKTGLKVRSFPVYSPNMERMSEYTIKALRRADNPKDSRELLEAINHQFFWRLIEKQEAYRQITKDFDEPVFIELSPPFLQHETDLFVRVWQVEDAQVSREWLVYNYLIPPQVEGDIPEISLDHRINTTEALELTKLNLNANKNKSLANIFVCENKKLVELFSQINPAFSLSLPEIEIISKFVIEKINIELQELNFYIDGIIDGLTTRASRQLLESWEELMVLIILKLGGLAAITKITSEQPTEEQIQFVENLNFKGYSITQINTLLEKSSSLKWLRKWSFISRQKAEEANLFAQVLERVNLQNFFGQNDLVQMITEAELVI